MTSVLNLSAEMGQDVLNHLRRIGDLPDNGVVAGQAVVSALMDLSGENLGVYNDLDVFRVEHYDNPLKKSGTVNFFAIDIDASGYEYRAELCTKHLYTVNGSYRQDMVNFVPCEITQGTSLSAGKVLAGFDLNCVQAGIDLKTRKLSWTPAFECFWKTRQIELATLFTPYSSIIRIAKKLNELKDVYCDVERSCAIAASLGFLLPDTAKENSLSYRGGPQFYFGKKAKENFDRYAQTLAPYFDVIPSDKPNKQGLWTLQPKNTVEDLSPCFDECGGGWGIPVTMPSALYSAALKESGRFKAKTEQMKDLPYFLGVCERQQGKQRYLSGQVSPTHVSAVKKFLDHHPETFHAFSLLPLSQQYNMVKTVKQEAKNRGTWVIGAIENDASSLDVATEAALRGFLDEWTAEMVASIVHSRLPLPRKVFGWRIKELVTCAELFEEGQKQGHCVGGYAHAVKRGYCRIVSLRHARCGTTTMELRETMGSWVVMQHKGKGNTEPSKAAQLVEWIVRLRLNGWSEIGVLFNTAIVRARRWLRKTDYEWLDDSIPF